MFAPGQGNLKKKFINHAHGLHKPAPITLFSAILPLQSLDLTFAQREPQLASAPIIRFTQNAQIPRSLILQGQAAPCPGAL